MIEDNQTVIEEKGDTAVQYLISMNNKLNISCKGMLFLKNCSFCLSDYAQLSSTRSFIIL